MDLSRRARANAAISPGVSPFCAKRGQEIGLEMRQNGFIGKLFNGLPDLFIVQQLRGDKMFDEFFEHALMLGLNAGGSN